MQETIVVMQPIVYLYRGQLATIVIKQTVQSDNLLLTKRAQRDSKKHSIDCQDFSRKLARQEFPVKVLDKFSPTGN